jgi:hypothetical protein
LTNSVERLSKDEVRNKVLELGRNQAAKHFGVNPSTFRDYLYRHNLPTKKEKLNKEGGSLTLKPDGVEVTSKASVDVSDPEKIVRERGLNPDDWDFVGLVVNEWDSPTGETLQQLKVQLKRKKADELILPARTDGPKYESVTHKPKAGGSLYVFPSDQQEPFSDPKLREKFFLFLEETQPDVVVNLGDTNDFPDISRYKSNPATEVNAKVQMCVQGSYDHIHTQRQILPDAEIVKLIGNHDVRLQDYVIERTPELFGLKRAQVPGIDEMPVLSPEYLLRLDELGVNCIDPAGGQYEHGQYKVSKYLAARHGWVATKGSGSSALKTLEHLGYSVIIAHTHRQSLVHKTVHDIDGNKKVLAAAESGCLCQVEIDGLGYTPAPDWQQGFSTATVYPDGKFKIDLATYVSGDLFWRGNRY